MTHLIASVLALAVASLASGCAPDEAHARRPRDRRYVQSIGAVGGFPDATVDSGVTAFIDEFAFAGDGSSTYVDCDSQNATLDGNAGSNPALTELTACARWYGRSSVANFDVIGIGTASSTNLGFKINVDSNGTIRGLVNGITFSSASFTAAAADWNLACLVFNAGNGNIWLVNNTGTASIVGSGTGLGASVTLSTGSFIIGARPTPTTNFHDQPISEAIVATDALIQAEIQELYNGSGEYQDPEAATWAANLTFVGRLGDDPADDIETAMRNTISGTDCTPTNYAPADLVAGGEG